MNIVVGCPVRDRAWMLPTWFEYTKRAFDALGMYPTWAFVLGVSSDDTERVIEEHTRGYKVYTARSHESEPTDTAQHQWSYVRFTEMADARNRLLQLVRSVEPDLFLSLDSDVLLAPQTLPNLLETVERAAAVGGKLYMTAAGEWAPSYAHYVGMGGLDRPDSDGVFAVDVIMALKLMTPEAYQVDYETNIHGEDVGWSGAVRRSGLKLLWDGRATNKHVMLRRQLYEPDPRCGF